MKLLDELQALGVQRQRLPDDLANFFGTFGSERSNVVKACDFVRQSPLIGQKIPVHGLMIDTGTGKLDWVVNGYQTWTLPARHDTIDFAKTADTAIGNLSKPAHFEYGEMKFPETKIGAGGYSSNAPASALPASAPASRPPPVPKLKTVNSSVPPPIRPPTLRR
jgi:carbonic anhydrase